MYSERAIIVWKFFVKILVLFQENGRGTLAGERTFGKGIIQNLQPLREGGVAVTTARYETPLHHDINKVHTCCRKKMMMLLLLLLMIIISILMIVVMIVVMVTCLAGGSCSTRLMKGWKLNHCPDCSFRSFQKSY